MTSLTRAAARERAALLADIGYDVSLDLTGDDAFRSTTTVRFRCLHPGATTFLDVAPVELHSARLNGVDLDVATAFSPSSRRLVLPELTEDNELVIDATMAYSHDGEGLHRHTDPADGRSYLYAMSFLDAAPRWFGCFDQPDLKAPLTLDVTCPEDWTVAGNGPAQQTGIGRWRIAAERPLATYFTTLVAGPYHVARDEHDGIPLVLLVKQTLAAELDRDAAALFDHTRRSLDELHRLFGYRYPWGDYAQAFVPEFNAGAMENPGCVTLRDEYVFRSRVTEDELVERDITIAHEMAHMWFGDLVTMRWWDDLWLNESFAEYLGQRVTGPHAWTLFGAKRKAWGYAADRRPSTHPVAGNGAPDAETALTDFDGISYAKGASVLRQLAVHLGDEVFLAGLRGYIDAHAYGNAEFADLVRAWERAGKLDLTAWTQAWLRTSGMDELRADGGTLLRDEPAGAPGRHHTLAVAAFDGAGVEVGRELCRVTGARTPLRLDAALVLPDATDETWATVRLGDAEWQAMPGMLAVLEDDRARVVVWNALRLAVEDALVDPRLALEIVVAAWPREQVSATFGAAARWAVERLLGVLLAPGDRDEARARLHAVALGTARSAPSGSGHQLAAFRVAAATASDADLLAAWRDGDALPVGVVMDDELRWAVLRRLAVLGRLDDSALAAARAADPGSEGAVHAARCSAARPDAAAKAAAWEALLHDPGRSNYELYALAEGFWQPGQEAVTGPYVERYVTDLPGLWQVHSGSVLDRLSLRMFPWPDARPETLAAADGLLAGSDLPPGVRRSVIDAADDLRRAVAVRARFAG